VRTVSPKLNHKKKPTEVKERHFGQEKNRKQTLKGKENLREGRQQDMATNMEAGLAEDMK
jgi:hypothetical protein